MATMMLMRKGDTASASKISCSAITSLFLNRFGRSSSHHDQSDDSERSESWPRPSSKFMNIDDLPELILVEILCRLPLKSVFQCKCVSKFWFARISHPYFVRRRFACFQGDEQRTLIFTDVTEPKKEDDTERKTEYISVQKHPVFKVRSKHRIFSLSFLPCYRSTGQEPLVVGTYNDLVCCCATLTDQRDYYICNPCTKQWVALPPAPQCHKDIRVGFICSPKEDGGRKEESCSINAADYYYRYKIVQIIISGDDNSFQFKVQIFSSESGKWTESLVLSPRSFSLGRLTLASAVAHNRMLYWLGSDFIIGLDPYTTISTTTTNSMINDDILDGHTYCCRFIDVPGLRTEVNRRSLFLGVRRGRLLVCRLFSYEFRHNQICSDLGISIWELEDDADQVDNRWCLVHIINVEELMISKNALIKKWSGQIRWKPEHVVLGFDPNKEHILYLEMFQHLVKYNIENKTLKAVTTGAYNCTRACHGRRTFRFVIPRWPTLPHQYAYASPDSPP